MKKNYFILVTLFLLFYSCLPETNISEDIQNGKEPSVETIEVKDVSMEKATFIGNVKTGNGYEVTSRGFIIDTLESVQETGEIIRCDFGKGSFSFTKEDLKSGKTYYLKAYAENKKGKAYGELLTFDTDDGLANVITIPVKEEDIIDGTVKLYGKIEYASNSPITESGICWGITENPTIENGDDHKPGNEISNDEFTVTLKNISGSQKYYYRSYAKNKYGTAYGESLSFDTPLIWENLMDFPGVDRLFAATFILGSDFYIVSGQGMDPSNAYLKDNIVYLSGSDNPEWKIRSEFPGTARRAAIGFSIGDFGYVGFGDPDKQIETAYVYDLYLFNPYLSQWSKVRQSESVRIVGTAYASSFTLNDKVYFIGGIQGRSDGQLIEYANHVYKGSFIENDSVKWERMNSFPITTWRHISFTYGNRAFVGLGETQGSGGNKSKKIYEYKQDIDQFIEYTTLPEEFEFGAYGTGIRVAATATSNGKAYFIGDGLIWELDLMTNSWNKKSRIPKENSGNNMFSLNNEVFIRVNGVTNTFFKYRPLWDN